MRPILRRFLLASAALAFISTTAAAQTARAQSALKDRDGHDVGRVTFEQVANGVLIKAELHDLPPGVHGFHVHAVGRCEPPFATAGGHFNPADRKHGFANADGPHAGDLPNLHVGPDGKVAVEFFVARIELNEGPSNAEAGGRAQRAVGAVQGFLDQGPYDVFDQDGSSVVVHAGTDDYTTDPAGNSGDRIACGVLAKG